MSMQHDIWSLDTKSKISTSSLKDEKELEDLIFEHIDIIDSNLLVINRQVRADGGPLDILCIDSEQNTVVIELKKDRTPRDVIAQALDYASSVSKYDYPKLCACRSENSDLLSEEFKRKFNKNIDADSQNGFNLSTRIIIVAKSMDSSTERIIKYLNEIYNVNINILFFDVFENKGERFISRAWMIDESENNISHSSAKAQWNGEFYSVFENSKHRNWKDAKKYGFISAGGGERYSNPLYKLELGDIVWVHIPGKGYCGVGKVISKATPADQYKLEIEGEIIDFKDLKSDLNADYFNNPNGMEHIVGIMWLKSVDLDKAIWKTGFFGNQNVIAAPRVSKWDFTVKNLKDEWSINI